MQRLDIAVRMEPSIMRLAKRQDPSGAFISLLLLAPIRYRAPSTETSLPRARRLDTAVLTSIQLCLCSPPFSIFAAWLRWRRLSPRIVMWANRLLQPPRLVLPLPRTRRRHAYPPLSTT